MDNDHRKSDKNEKRGDKTPSSDFMNLSSTGNNNLTPPTRDWQCPQCGKMVAHWRKTCPNCATKPEPKEIDRSGKPESRKNRSLFAYMIAGVLGLIILFVLGSLLINPDLILNLAAFVPSTKVAFTQNPPNTVVENTSEETQTVFGQQPDTPSPNVLNTREIKITETATITQQPTKTKVTQTSTTESSKCSRPGEKTISPKDQMALVCVPAGEFLMGSNSGDDNERPIHAVQLDAFWMDQHEVTNIQFAIFVNESDYVTDAERKGYGMVYGGATNEVKGADWRHPSGPDSSTSALADHPVVQVSWNDASAYCRWAGRRLPTEAEWEKAAGGGGQRYPWGNQSPSGTLLNMADVESNSPERDVSINDGYAFTSPVGAFPAGASPYNILDMAGNVWEWVYDWYGRSYYADSPKINPMGVDSSDSKVHRGGSWYYKEWSARIANRSGGLVDGAINDVGFRCAMSSGTTASPPAVFETPPDQFISYYYSLLNTDQCDLAYQLQTADYQKRRSNPYEDFISWCKKWDRVQTVDGKVISNNGTDARVSVTVLFYLDDKSYSYPMQFDLVSNGKESWLIADN